MDLYAVAKLLLLPPASLLLLIGVGLWMVRGTLGRMIIFVAWSLLMLMSLPATSSLLLEAVQEYPPLPPDAVSETGAEAIVILGAAVYRHAVEYGETTVGTNSMKRCRYGAWLHRRTGLPIYVSGGRGEYAPGPAMVRFLEDELGVPVAVLESESRNTWENAAKTAPLLREAGIERVFLVTDAWHMPRSVAAFERTGLVVVPAPTYFRGTPPLPPGSDVEPPPWSFGDWFPQPQALQNSFYAVHELIGQAYYGLRARRGP